MTRDQLKLIVPETMIQVTKKQFYSAVGPVENLQSSAIRHHYPVNCLECRWTYYAKIPGQWLGEWKAWGIDLFLLDQHPAPHLCFMSEYALNSFIIF